MTQNNQHLPNQYKNLLIVLLLLICIILGAISIFRPNGITIEQYNALEDTLRSTRDKDGLHKATIQSLEFENKRQLLSLKSKDSTIIWLQSVVKSFDGKIQNAIVLGISTAIKGTTPSTVLPGTFIIAGDTIHHYPKYESKWMNKWENGYILASKDSVYHLIKINNELEIIQGFKKKPLFSFKKIPLEIQVKNLNPNTETKELRDFTVKNPETRFGLGVNAGVCFTGDLQLKPYVGIGVQYTLIRFNKWGKH